jgi:hypothetical protein
MLGFDFMYIYNALPRLRDLVNMLEMGRIEPARRRNTVYVEHCLSSSAPATS